MNYIVTIFGLVLILYYGKPLLLPLATAVFMWYLIKSIAHYYQKYIKSGFLSQVLAGGSLMGLVYFFLVQVQPMFFELYRQVPEINRGVESLLMQFYELTGIEILLDSFPTFQEIAASIGGAIAGFGTIVLFVFIYMIFIFVEQSGFHKKIAALFPTKRQLSQANFLLASIDQHMKKYLILKTAISLATGLFSYVGLVVLGVPFSLVWAFIIFILNYIPTIGTIIGGLLPPLYILAVLNDVRLALVVAIWIAIVNFIFGNILDPKMTGKSLNLSPLVILINMVFWGLIWGPVGMFFSVPILAMVYIATAQFDGLRWISILLSADGKIPDKNEE